MFIIKLLLHYFFSSNYLYETYAQFGLGILIFFFAQLHQSYT